MPNDTHHTDRNGHFLEAIWDLNDRFNAGDDDALEQQFKAVHHYCKLAAEDERAKIVAWLRDRAHIWATDTETADEIENEEHLK